LGFDDRGLFPGARAPVVLPDFHFLVRAALVTGEARRGREVGHPDAVGFILPEAQGEVDSIVLLLVFVCRIFALGKLTVLT